MTRILGLDLSLTATGVAWEGGTEVWNMSKFREMHRLARIRSDVWNLFMLDPRGVLFVLEGYSYASANQAHQLGELGGVVRCMLYENHIAYVDVPPAVLKKFATGKGNVGKDEVLAAAIRRFGFEGSNNNEADAWMLYKMGEAHYAMLEGNDEYTDYQREALAKIVWPAKLKEASR